MELAFTIFGLGVVDAIVTQLLKDSKRQSLVIWLRVATTACCVLFVAPEVFSVIEYARAVLLRWM